MMTLTTQITLHPSALDRAIACPASLYPREDEILIRHEAGEAARIGTAVHAILAHVSRERLTMLPDVEPFAIEADVADHLDDVRIMASVGLKWLRESGQLGDTSWRIEEQMEIASNLIRLRGRADRLRTSRDEVDRIVIDVEDYKTGEKTDLAGCRQQMTAYAFLVAATAEELPDDAVIRSRVLWLRDQEVSTLVFTPAELRAWWEDLPKAIRWDGQYTPGEACRYCPRVAECPGRATLYRASVEALTSGTALVPVDGTSLVDPTTRARAIVQAKLLRTFIDDYLKAEAQAVELAGGSVAVPDGRRIVLKTRAGSARIDPKQAIPELRRRGMTDEELAAAVTLSKRPVESFIGSKAERGEKGRLIESTMAAWEEAGIIKRGKPVRWVEVVSEET